MVSDNRFSSTQGRTRDGGEVGKNALEEFDEKSGSSDMEPEANGTRVDVLADSAVNERQRRVERFLAKYPRDAAAAIECDFSKWDAFVAHPPSHQVPDSKPD